MGRRPKETGTLPLEAAGPVVRAPRLCGKQTHLVELKLYQNDLRAPGELGLVLADLINEWTLEKLAAKIGVSVEILQRVSQEAGVTFEKLVTIYAHWKRDCAVCEAAEDIDGD